MRTHNTFPLWTAAFPVLSIILAVVFHQPALSELIVWAALPFLVLLFINVFSAVHHAETIALRIGNPYGTVVLAVAVTIVEVSIIVTVLMSSQDEIITIARDTVFAAIMIALNGIIGLALLVGGLRYRQQEFKAQGTTAALSVLATVAVLALVLPDFTLTVPGPIYAPAQLVFVAVVSLSLYGIFLVIQMISHRDDFTELLAEETHRTTPDNKEFVAACILLPTALVSVILVAELLAPVIEMNVSNAGLPVAIVGVVIAILVLLPEATAAIRAAFNNRLQTSLNLALGSALASICLTIPVVAMLTLFMGKPLALGLEGEHIVLLLLSLFISTITLAMGRTTILQGAVHLVIFGAYLTIAAVP
ncbi:calcium:proton antiporter [Rhodocyclaceae bacterium SMB388]